MYAIISDGGRQYRVEEGQILDIDYRQQVSTGDQIQFDRVLAVSDDDQVKIGSPGLDGVAVSAQVLGVRLGPKLIIQKFRRRKTYRRKTGHRQIYTRVRIERIQP